MRAECTHWQNCREFKDMPLLTIYIHSHRSFRQDLTNLFLVNRYLIRLEIHIENLSFSFHRPYWSWSQGCLLGNWMNIIPTIVHERAFRDWVRRTRNLIPYFKMMVLCNILSNRWFLPFYVPRLWGYQFGAAIWYW